MIYDINGQARWLLNEHELRTWLAERGATWRDDIPATAKWRGERLYDARRALRFCEQLEAWRT
jgi:hypothetical protein